MKDFNCGELLRFIHNSNVVRYCNRRYTAVNVTQDKLGDTGWQIEQGVGREQSVWMPPSPCSIVSKIQHNGVEVSQGSQSGKLLMWGRHA